MELVARARHQTLPRPANPFLDPQHDPYNPLRYIASNTLTTIAITLILVVALFQTYFVRRYRTNWMLAMTIGCYTFAIGFATRFVLHKHPESKGVYIAEYLFVVLSPCAFIAAEYVLLGRLARFLRADAHLLVSPRRITVVFITSDIVTFLIQAAGGSVSIASNTVSTAQTGSHIFLAGLVLQLLSFSLFTLLALRFALRVKKYEPAAWNAGASAWYKDWRALLGAMALSFLGILIRSVYRVVELSQGYFGKLATTESLFYGLDTLPLLIAIAAYVPFWPGRFIGPGEEVQVAEKVVESSTASSAEKVV